MERDKGKRKRGGREEWQREANRNEVTGREMGVRMERGHGGRIERGQGKRMECGCVERMTRTGSEDGEK